jgi:hypothetical protein
MQVHRKFNSAVFFNIENNYGWYTEYVELHMVVSQLKTLESSWSGGNEENYKTPQ